MVMERAELAENPEDPKKTSERQKSFCSLQTFLSVCAPFHQIWDLVIKATQNHWDHMQDYQDRRKCKDLVITCGEKLLKFLQQEGNSWGSKFATPLYHTLYTHTLFSTRSSLFLFQGRGLWNHPEPPPSCCHSGIRLQPRPRHWQSPLCITAVRSHWHGVHDSLRRVVNYKEFTQLRHKRDKKPLFSIKQSNNDPKWMRNERSRLSIKWSTSRQHQGAVQWKMTWPQPKYEARSMFFKSLSVCSICWTNV